MVIVEIRGGEVWRRIEGERGVDALPLPSSGALNDANTNRTEKYVELLTDWCRRYRRAVAGSTDAALLQLGTELFGWLNQGDALSEWTLGRDRELEIRADPRLRDTLTEAVLAAPWELLAHNGRFFAQDRSRLFVVSRRCAGTGESTGPQHSDLSLLFMAAAPKGQTELDYEAEEAAIFDATKAKDGRSLGQVEVEESGELSLLIERVRLDGPYEALHISAHGDLLRQHGSSEVRPVLLLESATGDPDPVSPDQLIGDIHGRLPLLIFVSACRTAEHSSAGTAGIGRPIQSSAPEFADPYVRQLCIRVPNTLGWDGSVLDVDATLFTGALYGALARGDTVPVAAALARRELFAAAAAEPPVGRHWHLARVYLGPGGGGPLCARSLKSRPEPIDSEQPFLDKRNQQSPVATRREFAGRRRQIQSILRGYRSVTGALIHGMGNLGKSSLAARVAARMPRHRTAVVFGHCHALAVFDALSRVAEDIGAEMSLTDTQALAAELGSLREQVIARDDALETAIRRLLKGVFKKQPVLLIIDDLEQSLEPPAPDKPHVLPAEPYRASLRGVLRAFRAASTESRLLLTSRFDFSLPDKAGGDVAADLLRVPLAPMRPRERAKQWRARKGTEGKEPAALRIPSEIVAAALAASGGNPGLQDKLTRPLLKGAIEEARAAIRAIETFRASGTAPPANTDLGDFFGRMAFETYTAALSPTERAALSAATLFVEELPIPRSVLETVVSANGVSDPGRTIDRLLALGILDHLGEARTNVTLPPQVHAAINPLARPFAPQLSATDHASLGRVVLPPLIAWLSDAEGNLLVSALTNETMRLAIEVVDSKVVARCAAAAAAFINRKGLAPHRSAELFLRWIAAHGSEPPTVLFLHRIALGIHEFGDDHPAVQSCWDHLLREFEARVPIEVSVEGCSSLMTAAAYFSNRNSDMEMRALREFERRAVFHNRSDARAMVTSLRASGLSRTATPLEVQKAHLEAVRRFEELGDPQNTAIAKRSLARALFRMKEFDQALAVVHEILPVAVTLASDSSASKDFLASVWGDMSDIRREQGQPEESMRILLDEVIPIYQSLDDKRSAALTRGAVANILEKTGRLEEALKIRREEELPVYEAIEDARAIVDTKIQIADILRRKGDFEAEFTMIRDELVPVCERFPDRSYLFAAKDRLATLLTQRGDFDAALDIRRQEELPMYTELDAKNAIAVTKGKIADILILKGDLESALAIWQQEIIPMLTGTADLEIARTRVEELLKRLAEKASSDSTPVSHPNTQET